MPTLILCARLNCQHPRVGFSNYCSLHRAQGGGGSVGKKIAAKKAAAKKTSAKKAPAKKAAAKKAASKKASPKKAAA